MNKKIFITIKCNYSKQPSHHNSTIIPTTLTTIHTHFIIYSSIHSHLSLILNPQPASQRYLNFHFLLPTHHHNHHTLFILPHRSPPSFLTLFTPHHLCLSPSSPFISFIFHPPPSSHRLNMEMTMTYSEWCVLAAYLFIIAILGTAGNALVLIVFYRKKDKQVFLCVVDCLCFPVCLSVFDFFVSNCFFVLGTFMNIINTNSQNKKFLKP